MKDDKAQAETAETENTAAEASETVQEVDWEAKANHWKEMSRKNEARAKSNAEKAQKFDELEEQSKSELQKAIERAEAAEKRMQAAEAEALRARVGAEKGIDPGLLVGESEEEIREHAEKLLKWRGPGQSQEKQPASTSSNLSGDRGDQISQVKQLSRDDLRHMSSKEIVQARKDGRLNEIMGVE